MSVAEDMVRFQLKGHIQGTQSWSLSLWMQVTLSTTPMSQSTLDAYSNTFKTFASTFCTAIASTAWGSGTQADSIEASYIPALQNNPAKVSPQAMTPVTGSGSALLPAYCACVTSFRSSDPSRGGRGRAYLPVTLATLSSSSLNQYSSAGITTINGAWLTMINSINAQTLPTGVTAQRVAVRSSSKGHALPIVRIITDSLPDVQHRRTDKLLATTSATGVPT